MCEQYRRGGRHVYPYIGRIPAFHFKFWVSTRVLTTGEADIYFHRHTLKFVLLEIGLSNSAKCAIQMERFLTIDVNWVTQPVASIDAYHGDRVAIFIKSDDDSELAVTVVWDFVQDTWCFWWVELDVVDVSGREATLLLYLTNGRGIMFTCSRLPLWKIAYFISINLASTPVTFPHSKQLRANP